MLVELNTFNFARSNTSSSYYYLNGEQQYIINTDMIIFIKKKHALMHKSYQDSFSSNSTLVDVDYYEIEMLGSGSGFTFYIKKDEYEKLKNLCIANTFKQNTISL